MTFDEQRDTDKRRDDVLRDMIGRPPQPHKPVGASKRKARPATKGRMRKGKARS